MANTNTLLTPTIIAREALRLLKNNLVMGNAVYRAYETEFPGTPKKGGTVTIRKPVKFTVTKARTRSNSNITENSITLTVSTQAHVSWSFYSKDLTLSIEEYSERYIRPAAAVLANTVDSDLCALYDDLWNSVCESTGFVTPHTFMVMGKAMQRLDEEAAPPEDRCIVLNPAGHWSMANALASLSIPNIPEKAIRKGYLGRIANCDVYMDQNIKTHSTGYWDTDTSNDGTGIELATAAPTGVTGTIALNLCDFDIVHTRVLVTGDVFTVAGAMAVNPMSGESTGVLRQFVVLADASCGSTGTTTEAGNTTVYIAPEMIHTGPYKTVYSYPNGGAVVDIFGQARCKYPQNLAFHKNCFALVMVPLEVPEGVSFSATVSEDGVSCRIVKDYDIDADEEVIRLDILYGVKTIYPELGVRIWGQQSN